MSTTVPDAISIFLGHCRYEKKLSAKTLKAYNTDLAQFYTFLAARQVSVINNVSKIDIRHYLEHIQALKPKSIKRKIATIKALFNFLEFDDLLAANPLRKMKIQVKEPRVLPTVMELPEITRILQVLYRCMVAITDKNSYAYKVAVRNAVVVELLFATGGRVSEITGLQCCHIDIQDGTVLLRGKGNKERLVQVCNTETLQLLRLYQRLWHTTINRAGDHFLVNRLGAALSTQSVRNMITSLTHSAGLNKHITPHVFRHSFATLLLERDVDIKYIQSLLGHSSIVTTQIYTHVNQAKQRQLLKAKHPRRDIVLDGG
jgi:integrase/recombinase XerD